jgi:hypothetical protein
VNSPVKRRGKAGLAPVRKQIGPSMCPTVSLSLAANLIAGDRKAMKATAQKPPRIVRRINKCAPRDGISEKLGENHEGALETARPCCHNVVSVA